MKAIFALALIIGGSEIAVANNHINGFRFHNCEKQTCVQVTAPEAWMSLMSGGFTTGGTTALVLRDANGEVTASYEGSRANFNPQLKMITLEGGKEGLVTFALDSRRIQTFHLNVNGGLK